MSVQKHVHFHRSIIEVGLTGKCIDKMQYIHTMQHYSAIKKGMK